MTAVPLPGFTAAGPPCHVIAKAGDKQSLCGVKDPVPRVVARHVRAHVNGWGMPVCEACSPHLKEAT